MDDDYFNGRWATGSPNYNNTSWQQGNQERLNEISRQQEAQRAAERQRIEASSQAWAEAMKPKPAPAISWPSPSHAAGGGGSSLGSRDSINRANVTPSYSSGGGSYYAPSLWERFVDFTFAPFRWAWALIKFVVKAALIVVALGVAYAVYLALNEPPNSVRSAQPSTPVAQHLAVPTPAALAPAAPAAVAPSFPRLGVEVEVRAISEADIARLALASTQTGALVAAVAAGSPAARSGLQPDDIIISLNHRSVRNGDELIQVVHEQRPGILIPIVFIREGQGYKGEIAPFVLHR